MVSFCWEPNRGLLLFFTMLCLVAKKLEEGKSAKEIVFLNTLLSMDPQGKLHFSRDQTRNCSCSVMILRCTPPWLLLLLSFFILWFYTLLGSRWNGGIVEKKINFCFRISWARSVVAEKTKERVFFLFLRCSCFWKKLENDDASSFFGELNGGLLLVCENGQPYSVWFVGRWRKAKVDMESFHRKGKTLFSWGPNRALFLFCTTLQSNFVFFWPSTLLGSWENGWGQKGKWGDRLEFRFLRCPFLIKDRQTDKLTSIYLESDRGFLLPFTLCLITNKNGGMGK